MYENLNRIKEIPFFKALEFEELLSLTKNIRINTFSKDEDVFKLNSQEDYIFFLNSGLLKLNKKLDSDKTIIRSLVHSGDFFGEEIIVDRPSSDCSAIILEDNSEVFSFCIISFKKVLSTNANFYNDFMKFIFDKIRHKDKRLDAFVSQQARERIIDFLKYNASNFGRKIGDETELNHGLTHQEIANFTGTSRQTVTNVLNDLKKANRIHFRRKRILIRDMAKLA